jgi:hypothetical protein
MAWLSQIVGPVAILPLALLLLLFPNGRLPSRRWRPLVWVLGLCTVFLTVGLALSELLDLGGGGQIPNPIGISTPPWFLAPLSLEFLVWFIALLASAAAPLVRLRRATGDERLQLKWLAYGAGVVASVGLVASLIVNDHPLVGESLGVLVVVGGRGRVPGGDWYRHPQVPPVRHRPADLPHPGLRHADRGAWPWLCRRGAASSSAHRRYHRELQPGRHGIDAGHGGVVPAGPTLDPAGGGPRFNRHRYDAARTIQTFSARLREQVDLDTLSQEVLAVVDHTMQPTTASLWLRPPKETSKSHPTGWDY